MNRVIPRKRFGQHFLVDQNVLDNIVKSFRPRADDWVLEIGPGTGALTQQLVTQLDHVYAVELDRDLAGKLGESIGAKNITVFEQDILKFELDHIDRPEKAKKLRIIGNLPYNISTPLLFHLLQSIDLIEDMVFMVQQEVALRLCASPGHKNYGRLSVMTALHLDSNVLFDVPPESFDPPPRVQSSVIQLVPSANKKAPKYPDRLSEVVKQAFSQRRKTLRNSLKNIISDAQFEQTGINPGLRAENLDVDQYIALSESSGN